MRQCLPFAVGLAFAFPAVAQDREVRVNVSDANGSLVNSASVKARIDEGAATQCLPASDGYNCRLPAGGPLSFNITAEGFKPISVTYSGDKADCSEFIFVLQPGLQTAAVTVLLSDSTIENTPESVVVVDREAIEVTSAPVLDDMLRQVAGFSNFRRSSSRHANPTAQGVSLRGVGSSGASRSVVLFDAVPLNDPFGGWVQWNRVPPIAVETVEVVRGGASSIYGSGGLSGALAIVPRRTDDALDLSAEISGGTQRTGSASVHLGTSLKGWTLSASASHFQTRGFVPVDAADRGQVDSFAGVRADASSFRLERDLSRIGRIFVRHSYFGESRNNGTPAQINRTHSRQFVLGGRTTFAGGPGFDWRAYGGTQVYDQTFSAVAAGRATESLTRLQRSPSQHLGFSGALNAAWGRNALLVGIEGREVRGASDEIGYFGGGPTSRLGAGGRERTFGAFFRDIIRIGEKVIVSGGIRYDGWRNFRALAATTSLASGITTATVFPDRIEQSWSPTASILFQPREYLSLHASASRSFRAPTLNELYRGFRVGSVVTNANENLLAERATNFEAGASFRHPDAKVRVTGFLSDVGRAISNVTISTTPSLITRERQNAAKTRSAGFEIDSEVRIKRLVLSGGYQFASSRVAEFPSNPSLVDKRIPQVPRHQFTSQARMAWRTWSFAAQARASGEQFDDDLNEFRLEPYFQLDAFVSKRFKEKIEVFAAVENVLNSRYSIGVTPLRTVSSPLSARIGIRWN